MRDDGDSRRGGCPDDLTAARRAESSAYAEFTSAARVAMDAMRTRGEGSREYAQASARVDRLRDVWGEAIDARIALEGGAE